MLTFRTNVSFGGLDQIIQSSLRGMARATGPAMNRS